VNVPGFVWTVVTWAYRSRILARLLFGVKVSPIGEDDVYFDISTWVLVRRAGREITSTTHLVDLGTGTQAIIGISLWRRRGCKVTSVDIDPEILRMARENVERNGAAVRTVQSRFFDSVPEPFDLVTFNPPYIRSEVGEARDLPEKRRIQWDGGPDGLEVTRDFLTALAARPHPARFCLALSSMHADLDVARADIESTPGITLDDVHVHSLLPITIFSGSNRTV